MSEGIPTEGALARRMQMKPRTSTTSNTREVEKPRTQTQTEREAKRNISRKTFVLDSQVMDQFTERINEVHHDSRGRHMKSDIAAAIIRAGLGSDIQSILSDNSDNNQQ